MSTSIKIASFEYAIIRLAQWAIINSDGRYSDLNDFSFSNSFTRKRILLYPFFLSTANGNRKEMFNLFNNFVAEDFGHCEFDVHNAIRNNDLKSFKSYDNYLVFESSTLSEIKQNSDSSDVANFITTLYDFNEKERPRFVEHTTLEIEHSIEVLKKKNGGIFINYDESALRSYSQYHNSWRLIRSLGKLGPQNPSTINAFLIAEPSMFKTDSVNLP